MTTKIVKDFTVGVLIMVISMFFLLPLQYFLPVGIEWWVIPLVVGSIVIFHELFHFGWKLAFKGFLIHEQK